MKTKLHMTAAEFAAGILLMQKAATSMETHVQTLLASGVYLSIKDGNTNELNTLAVSLSKGTRKAAVGAWIEKFAPVVPNDNKEAAKTAPYKFSRDKLEKLVGEAKPTAERAQEYAETVHGTHWTEFKPDQLVPEEFDFRAAMIAMLKKVKTLQGKGTKIKGADLIEQMANLTATKTEVASL